MRRDRVEFKTQRQSQDPDETIENDLENETKEKAKITLSGNVSRE